MRLRLARLTGGVGVLKVGAYTAYERELLHQLRISGSAIGAINMAASQAWGKVYREFSSPFEKRLETLKGELLKLLGQG